MKVNRPGLKVSFRQGYYARDTLQPFDREEFLAYSRISAAASHERDLGDIPFQISTEKVVDAGGQPLIWVNLRIDPARIEFKQVNGRHTGRLRVVLFYADGKGNFLGEDWKNVDFRLLEDTYRSYMALAVPFSLSIPLLDPKQIVKVIVFDMQGSRVGSRLVRMR